MNPGSLTELETTNEGYFKYLFITLETLIIGWEHCKLVIVVDDTFLRNSFSGILLTACTKDANENIFPLAFGVADFENNASWIWFFTKLRQAYGARENLAIIFDRHDSIAKAVKTVYPDSTHGLCLFHLLNNLKLKFKRKVRLIKEPFNKAATAYTIQEFEYYIDELDRVDNRIRPYLIKVGFERWARVFSCNNRYSIMTSNIAESMNSVNNVARGLPVATLVESLRSLIQRFFWEHKNEAQVIITKLATKLDQVLRTNYVASLKMKVHPGNQVIFNILDETESFIVNMQDRKCTCKHFDMDEMSCSHAMAAIRHRHLNYYNYCSKYCFKDTILATYSGVIYPLGSPTTWEISEEVKMRIVKAPEGKCKLGRPK